MLVFTGDTDMTNGRCMQMLVVYFLVGRVAVSAMHDMDIIGSYTPDLAQVHERNLSKFSLPVLYVAGLIHN